MQLVDGGFICRHGYHVRWVQYCVSITSHMWAHWALATGLETKQGVQGSEFNTTGHTTYTIHCNMHTGGGSGYKPAECHSWNASVDEQLQQCTPAGSSKNGFRG